MSNKMFKFMIYVKAIASVNMIIAFGISLICAALAVLNFLGIFEYKMFYINESDSAPHGVYMTMFDIQSDNTSVPLTPGCYYLVSLPVDVLVLDKKSGFNLIKVCRALPGTEYHVTGKELITLGRSYPISSDKQGLPHIKPGKYVVPEDSALFLNEPDTSFDSRYLGPINKRYVKEALYYIGSSERYTLLGKCYALSLIISLFIHLSAYSKSRAK